MTSDRTDLHLDTRAYIVLFVDDDVANLETARYALDDQFDIRTASTGSRALEMLEELEVAVLVTDQRMPEMTGVEVCAEARRIAPHTVRMIVTAYADVGAVVKAINDGAVSRYLPKPFQHEQLVGALVEGIQTFAEGADLRQVSRSLLHEGPRLAARAVEAEIAHDLSNMLVPLNVLMQVVQNDVSKAAEPGGADPQLLAQIAQDVEEACQSLVVAGAFVERLKSGAGKLSSGRAELGRLVDATVRMFEPRIRGSADVAIQVDEDAVVALDPAGVTQVFMNLLVNALLALEESGRPGHIHVLIDRADNMARLIVRDDGPGIPNSILPHIFESRFTTRAKGTGRGLAIARRVVMEAGGEIEATNRPAGGAQFTVLLPPTNEPTPAD